MPIKRDLDQYECRHGLGYTSIMAERNGIRAIQLAFDGEIHQVKLLNTSAQAKKDQTLSFCKILSLEYL